MQLATESAIINTPIPLTEELFSKHLGILEALTNNVNLTITLAGILFSIVFLMIFGLLGFSVYMVVDSKNSQREAKKEIKKIKEMSSWAEKQKTNIVLVTKETSKLFKDFEKLVKNGQVKLTKEQEAKILKRIEKVETSTKEVNWPTMGTYPLTVANPPNPTFLSDYSGPSTPSLSVGEEYGTENKSSVNLSKLFKNLDKLKGTVTEITSSPTVKLK